MSKETKPALSSNGKKAAGGPAAPKAPASQAKTGLPVLVELVFTLSRIIVLLAGVAVAVLSYLAGCPALVIGLRAGGALLAVGLAVWFFTWFFVRGAVLTNQILIQEAVENGQPVSTIQTKA
jgi:hypothetical protein